MTGLEDIVSWRNWFPFDSDSPLIIAGPCSAESEEQVMQTARELAKIDQVKVFRSGVWKPRTRPGHFEGMGEEALKWLHKVKSETGLLTTVEVANPDHIKACLDNGIDILWIGARTTANPFSVQELADTLKGIDIPVLVKNPVNPDLSLWIGAIERMYKSGIRRLAAVHRGFFPFENTSLRNIPKWELVIELKRTFPNLPIFTDPSHIAGNREFIQGISQKAMDLNMDGLMVESHISPDKAKSDAKQQITPAELSEMLDYLTFRKANGLSIQVQNVLEQYREQIDSIDNQMLELLAQRMDVVSKIGEYKCENNITILQLRRWEAIIQTRSHLGTSLGLDEEFVIKLLQLVHKESIHKQSQIMEKLHKCQEFNKKKD
jgi:chorismate mutase